MDYSSYAYLAIALFPFIAWGTLLLVIWDFDADNKRERHQPSANAEPQNIPVEIVIIPYGLIFPIYFRFPAGSTQRGG